MKITIDVDCTPDEARAFLGLPDVAPMQEAAIAKVQEQLMAALSAMDQETMLKTWLPGGLEGLERMQKAFWSQFAAGGQTGAGASDKKSGDKKS